MLNSKILILCNELREMSIHINLCLKFQKFHESIKIVKKNTSDIMNVLEKVLKYHTNMDTKAPIDGRSSGTDAAFQTDQSKI